MRFTKIGSASSNSLKGTCSYLLYRLLYIFAKSEDYIFEVNDVFDFYIFNLRDCEEKQL
jgi:hypothetical protein